MEKIKLKFVYEHKWIDHTLDVNLFIDDRLIFSGIGKADELITIDKKIAIEYNGTIIPKSRIKKRYLKDKDIIEIVNFIGGG